MGEFDALVQGFDGGKLAQASNSEKLKRLVAKKDGSGVAALVDRATLEAGSPKPFVGRPDPRYPELDTLDRLYMPRFLVREWGYQTFLASKYYAQWAMEAARRGGSDPKPSERGKRK
jgi:hypothetical protein